MDSIFNILVFGFFLVILVKSADLVEESLVVISKKLGINPFITGFVILSGASTLPELSVAVNAAVQQVPDLSIGNLFGATIFLLTVVIGLFAIKHRSIPFHGSFGPREVILSLILIATQILAVYDQRLGKVEGICLLGGYLLLIAFLIKSSKQKKHILTFKIIRRKRILYSVLLSIIGLIGLLLSANFIVNIVIDIAKTFHISETLLGIFMLGIGTNLPELAILFASRNAEEDKLAVGNFIGSAVANVPTLGLLAVLLPHTISGFNSLFPVLVGLFFTCLLFAIFVSTKEKLSAKEATVLIFMFILMVGFQAVNA